MIVTARVDAAARQPSALWIPAVLGLLCFIAITNGTILNPLNASWMMGGDPAQHFAGWSFFRHTPWLQFPLGANPGFGELIGSSIVFSDSIPLFALLFKFLGPVLPDTFQYFGLWLALCMILQGVFAWLLLARFTDDKLVLAIASCFFMLAPPMLLRLKSHEALVAHWLLLAALYLSFTPPHQPRKWLLLLAITSLVHPYLLAMVLTLWLVSLGRCLVLREVPAVRLLGHAASSVILLGVIMLSIGYSAGSSLSSTAGFGIYRMNALALIDASTGLWPTVFPHPASTPGDYEGYNYLGAGMLLLLALNLYDYAVAGKRVRFHGNVVWPLVIVSLGLTLYALSNQVALGAREWFAYPLPDVLNLLTGPFRASGRFFWPVFYLIYLGAFCFFLSGTRRGKAILVLGLLLALQCVDLSTARTFFLQRFSAPASTPLQAPFWRQVPAHYQRIAFVVPDTDPPDFYMPLALFAAAHKMSINTGNLARVDPAKLSQSRATVLNAILQRNYEPATLYVFFNDVLWDRARATVGAHDFLGTVDGIRLLAPGWSGCTMDCGAMRIATPVIAPGKPGNEQAGATQSAQSAQSGITQSGATIDFRHGGNAARYLYGDWGAAEATGSWTQGLQVFMSLHLQGDATRDWRVTLDAHALHTPGKPTQQVEVIANGKPVSTLVFAAPATPAPVVKQFTIPASVMAGSDGWLDLTFLIKDPVSPKQRGINDDRRLLGMFVRSLTITAP